MVSEKKKTPSRPSSPEDKRGQGAMLLALAEAQLAKALAGEALSNLELVTLW
jgi:hypothetical protein